MKKLRLPRLISSGMVLQQKKRVRIWGFDEPGRKVVISFLGKEYEAIADEAGYFEAFLEGLEPGGPYVMNFRDDADGEITLENILIGDVWMCSGQSNMELPMMRVRDKYPDEISDCDNDRIRTFKIVEHADFHGPLTDHLTGQWKAAGKDTILDFSATAYFFARKLYELAGVPAGLINASLGGSRIQSWMGRDMLNGYEDFLALADQYADDEFVAGRLARNEKQAREWDEYLNSIDLGLKENWRNYNGRENMPEENPAAEDAYWQQVQIPFFFKDTALKGFIGSVWFRRKFTVPGELAGKEAKIWLGTIVDNDTVYINGVEVGHTDYQYPPRKYAIPANLLREGENSVVIRVKCQNGQGRFTPGKTYAVFNDQVRVELAGTWYYRIGGTCGQVKETDFVNWKPTGLYNGMMAPCHKYAVAGVLWYQGEANSWEPENYLDLTKRMVKGFREKWEDDTLPYFYVQLPNFCGDVYDIDRDGRGSEWGRIRELQREALQIPGTGMAVAIDLGEDNDLHPLNKKDVGSRLAMLAAARFYGNKAQCGGPVVKDIKADTVKREDGSRYVRVEILCGDVSGGMYAFSENKGDEILDFELADAAGAVYRAQAEIADDRIILSCEGLADEAVQVRYCYANTNRGALVYNRDGFPMSPFCIELEKK